MSNAWGLFEMNEKPEKNEAEHGGAEVLESLELEKKRADEYLTRLRYMQADFENLKKRQDRQVEEARRYGNERLILELLPVVDELEAAIDSCKVLKLPDAAVQGVEMTLKRLRKTLEHEGVTPITCLGKPFDPSRHNAVEMVEREDAGECTVIQEIRKGYMMKEKVIRPSVVKVAVKSSQKTRGEMKTVE